MSKLFVSFLMLLLCLPVFAAAVYDLPADRKVDWSSAGIPGGIPNRTTICANVKNAPYNAYGDGVHDDTEVIQRAIDACPVGQVVYIPAGHYRISTHNLSGWLRPLVITKGIVLRGDGPDRTVLESYYYRSVMIGISNIGTNYLDIVSGYTKGSSSMTLADASSVAAGEYFVIDQENDNSSAVVNQTGSGGGNGCVWCGFSRCSSDHHIADPWGQGPVACDDGRGIFEGGRRTVGQIIKITAKNGNTISFEPSLYWNYVSGAEPRILEIPNMIEYVGVENLGINHSHVPNGGDSISFTKCAYCWLKNVEIMHNPQHAVYNFITYRNEYRENYIHHSYCYPGNYGYGFFVLGHPTANLIENNIMDNLHVAYAIEGGGGGNVIAYNYFDHLRYNQAPCRTDAPENVALPSAAVNHGAHPVHNLYEGNIGYKLGGDYYWGTTSHHTMFRNKLSGYDPTYYENMVYDNTHYRIEALEAIILEKYEQYYSILGNVLGTPGVSTDYELENFDPSNCWVLTYNKSYIYRIGFVSSWECNPSLRDLVTRDTLLRHGNYDYVTNSFIWDSNSPDHNLPASLYLSSKPSWWGSLPWPAFGPDPANPNVLVSGMIPAQVRYNEIIGAPLPNCTESDWTHSDGACQPDNTTTRTWTRIGSCVNGTQHNATETIACVYTNASVEGDLNGDGVVDISDLALIGTHFGRTSSHPQWNVTIDVVASNEIDVFDMVYVASRFS